MFRGSGSVSIGQDLIPDDDNDSSNCNSQNKAPYNLSLTDLQLADTSIGDSLLHYLKQSDEEYPVSAIYSPNDDTPIPLYWGELIPLLLMLREAASGLREEEDGYYDDVKGDLLPFQPLIWTFPHRRYTKSPEMVPELLRLGGDVMKWIVQRPERIGVIVSGDLSHTHLENGPYGYSPASATYDKAIGSWAGNSKSSYSNPCHPEAEDALIYEARSLQPRAMSCGFTGYVMWHGMMMCDNNEEEGTPRFQSTLLANGNVTYYGMCCALFETREDEATVFERIIPSAEMTVQM
ncbi:MAG: hypothetical protein SGILL_006399 [Bacillariaceae sp.]